MPDTDTKQIEKDLSSLELIVRDYLQEAKWRLRILTGLVALCIVVLAVLAIALNNSNDISSEVSRDHDAALGQCERVQVLRDRVNANSFIIYQELVLLSHIIGERSLLRHLTPADRRARTAGANELARLSGRIEKISPTSCEEAIEHPLTYQPPEPVPFAK